MAVITVIAVIILTYYNNGKSINKKRRYLVSQ